MIIYNNVRYFSFVSILNIKSNIFKGGNIAVRRKSYIVRKYFYKEIRLVTNGILLNKMSDDFYKTIINENIIISFTKYISITSIFI